MSVGQHTVTIQEYLSAFNAREWDTLTEFLTNDVVEHGVHEVIQGREVVIENLQGHFTTFPDYAGHTEAIVEEGDTVVVRYSASGTHTGKYKGVEPTGIYATWTGMAMYRIEEDRIAEIWVEEDRLGLLEQLELVNIAEQPHLRL